MLVLASLWFVHGGRQERQTLFMALIGSAVTPGKLGYHRAKGMGVAPRRVTPVEPDASIGARPVRRRLIEVIPSHDPGFPRKEGRPRRSNLDLLSDCVSFQIECGRQGNTPKDVSSGPLWFKAGGHECFVRIPSGGSGLPRREPLRPFNPAGVGSSRPGNRRDRLSTEAGVRAKHPAAKSSTMRGAKALASESDPGRCRTGRKSVIGG